MPVFLSHQKKDADFAKFIYNYLTKYKIRCYIDEFDEVLKRSNDITRIIMTRISQCTHMLAVVSPNTQSSWWVPFEIGVASQAERRIASMKAATVTLPEYLEIWPVMTKTEHLDHYIRLYYQDREILLLEKKAQFGRLAGEQKNHLGIIISNVLSDVLRPFLEKWQVDYRHWWENQSNPRLSPLDRQREYPKLQEFLDDWSNVRAYMRQLQNELVRVYQLVDVHSEC